MASKKINLSAVIAAVGTGAGYRFAYEGAANRVDFVADNYLVIKSMGAGILGSAMVYFGKGDSSKAAGYALLGIAGDAGAGKVQNLIVTTAAPDNLQGLAKLQRVRSAITPKKRQAMMAARGRAQGGGLRERIQAGGSGRGLRNMITGGATSQMRPGMMRPETQGGVDFDALAMSDVIYNMK